MITDGLVFYAPLWKHRTNKSPFLSQDDYEHSCTVTGAVWTSEGRDFDGNDDVITIPHHADLAFTTVLTLESWILTEQPSSTTTRVLVGKCTTHTDGYALTIRYISGTNYDLELRIEDGVTAQVGNVTDGWHHIVGTYDSNLASNHLKIYVDNILWSQGAKGNDLNTGTNNFVIGGVTGRFAKVTIGEVKVYNRVLSTTERQCNYNETKYEICNDWNNDGDFADTNEDITGNIKSVHFSRGKSDELGKAEVGQCSIVLNNADGLYTPSNSAGGLYGKLLPKRPLSIRANQYAIDYPLFYGFIEEIIPHPHLSEQDCIITATDGLDFLSRHDMSTALYKDTLTGTIHGYILTDAGWSATMRTLDTGQNTVPYWYGHDVKARFAQEEIDDNEQGFSYIDGSGYFNFEDRHHRSTTTHQTSQATFTNTMANMTYSLNPRNVYNIIKTTITPWTIQALTTLWTLQETPTIPIGETYTYWGEASVSGDSVFVDAWTTPDATDYTATPDTVSIVTTKFARTIKLAITNTGTAPVLLSLLRARGTYYNDQTKVTFKAEDSTSQTSYQKRTLEFDGKYQTDNATAQSLCNYAIGKYKDPRAELSMSAMNQDDTILTNILGLEMSDRITIVNTELGLNAGYFIDYMEHDISMGGKLHTVNYHLADCINEDFWCLGYSKLGTQTKLGF